MLESIPQDVVDIIISHLGDDNDALKQCSLISYSCLSPSRRQLFSTVSLCSAQRCQQLNDLLTTNPSLTTYIRHVHIDGKQKSFDPRRSHCWVFEPTLLSVLNTIAPRLQSLALHCIFWEGLPLELQRALLGILHTPGIVDVTLASVHRFPTNHLPHLSHLKRLSLLSLFGTSRDNPDTTIRTPLLKRQQLQALEFDQRLISVRCVSELEPLWDMSQLRELCITGSCTRMFDVASSLIADASQSLELFAWHFQYPLRIVTKPNEFVSRSLDISGLSTLRFLFLKSALHEGLVELLPWLVRSLRIPTLRRTLECVIIVLDSEENDWNPAYIQRTHESCAWSEIDAALMEAPQAARLMIILRGAPVMGCRVGDCTTKIRPSDILARQMPLLSRAGILQVQVNDDRPGVDTTWEGFKKMMR